MGRVKPIWKTGKRCGVGQGPRVCGTPAHHAVAVAEFCPDAFSDMKLGPAVIFLCPWHFRNPAVLWEGRAQDHEKKDS